MRITTMTTLIHLQALQGTVLSGTTEWTFMSFKMHLISYHVTHTSLGLPVRDFQR